jgi:large subunit ribosomal protein L6
MVQGVSEGYKKSARNYWCGLQSNFTGGVLELNLGYSHPIFFVPPEGIEIEVDTKTRKNPISIFRELTRSW